MKKISILVTAILALVFNACSTDDEFTFVAKPDPEGITFMNTFLPTYTLKPSNATSLAERFVWNEVDMDVQTTVRYELQASADESFQNMTVIESDIAATNQAVTVGELLALAEEAGLDTDPDTDASNSGTVYFRVRAYAGENAATTVEQFSEPVAITVELVEDTTGEVELPKIYMVGSFQEAGGYGANWTPADGVPLAASGAGKTDYEGFVYLNVDKPEFKFLPTNASFDGDYGDAGETNGAFTGKLKQEGESNAGTPDGTAGYYWVKVDTEKMTYSLTKVDWGVIGNATPTGWDSDTDMVYNPETKLWTLTLDLTQQEAPDNGLKFRANDEWVIEYGDNGADGTLDLKGANIGVPENGNYTVTMDLSNPRNYTYTLIKN